MTRAATTISARLSGTLSRNTQRQPRPSTITPPRAGPTANESPDAVDHSPTATARWWGPRTSPGCQADRNQQRRTEALHHPPGEQHAHRPSESADQHAEPKQRDAEHEPALAPAPGAKHAAGHQQARVHLTDGATAA